MQLLVTSIFRCYENTKFSGRKTQKICMFRTMTDTGKHTKWRKKYQILLTLITTKSKKDYFLVSIKNGVTGKAYVKIFTFDEKIIFTKVAITRYYNVGFFYIADKTTTFFSGFGINCCFLGMNGKFKFNHTPDKNQAS